MIRSVRVGFGWMRDPHDDHVADDLEGVTSKWRGG
jgi:hypothetical protein